MATATTAPPAPFVVGRPAPNPPLSSLGSGVRYPELGGRAKTTLGLTTAVTRDTGVPPSSQAVAAALLRHRATMTSHSRGWPRLVVRDVSGRVLDTFTTLQDAIYRASWTVKTLHEWPVSPLQWRLPKAPVPSRPDFSRANTRALTSYNLDITRSYRHEVKSAPAYSRPVVEIDVDDVSFVAESLKLLPHLPSFAFLRHSLLAGERTYVRVVGSLLLHQRLVRLPDKRRADYSFPGFCSGCRRAGFCYGCAKNPNPHVHEDIPMRTGGGFVFYRRDRPVHQDPRRHPSNWPAATGDPETDLRHIIERCGGLAAYERAAKAAHGAMESGQVTSQLPFLPTFSRVRLLSGPWPRQKNIFPSMDGSDRERKEGEEEGEEDEEEEGDDDEEEREEGEEGGVDDHHRRRRRGQTGDRPWRKSALKKDSVDSRSDERKYLRRSVTIATGAPTRVRTAGETSDDDEEEAGREETEQEADETEALQRETEDDTEEGGGRETEYDSGIDGSDRYRSTSRRKIGVDHTSSSLASRPSTLSPPRSGVTFDRSRSGSRSRSKSPGVAFGGSLRNGGRGTSSVSQDTSESAESRKSRLENIPFAKKREDVLYTAPSFFQPVKRQRKSTVAKDPFSTDREYDIPKGGSFQLKKGERKATQFVNVKRGDPGWKPPKKFELKQQERQSTQFWSRSPKGKGKGRRGQGDDDEDEAARRRRRRLVDSEDSGLDSDLRSASTRGKDKGTGEDENEKDKDTDGTKDQETDVTGDGSGGTPEEEKKARKEIVKKARRPISPPGVKRRQRTPSPPPREPTPEPPPPPTPPSPSPPPVEDIPLPKVPLPDIALPDLPEWKQAEKAAKQKKQRFSVGAPPPALKEVPKKRKPPPRARRPLKLPVHRLKTKPAEAPVNPDQVQDMQDPLDWLAKYCIINPDRLPLYEMIFESVIADQTPRYTKPPPHPSVNEVIKEAKREGEEKEEEVEGKEGKGEETTKKGGKKGGKKKKREKSTERADEDKSPSRLAFLERSMNQSKVGLSLPEQQLEKLVYTLDTLHHKLEGLGSELTSLEDKRMKQVAERARELFPEVASPDYVPKTKKKKGKKSKSKQTAPAVKLRPQDITDEVILARLDDKMLAAIRHEPEVRQTELEIERAREKMSDVTERLEELASEKLLTDAFCMNHYFLRQGINSLPHDFRRQQSELFNRLNPDPDFEMNLEEVEEALQHINGHLLTQKEFFFLYNVLNLPGRTTINFRLFSVIAALSEKVTQLDPVIRKLINNTDYNALDIKMEKCRELFRFVEEDDVAPRGSATADRLAVELTAGGLTPEHTRFVLSKFNRESRGLVDFLDFVTYIPLFILIHRRIISHPLREELDL